MKNDASDLPLIITDAINDVEISSEESIVLFPSDDDDKVIAESMSKLMKKHSEITEELVPKPAKKLDNVPEDNATATSTQQDDAKNLLPSSLTITKVVKVGFKFKSGSWITELPCDFFFLNSKLREIESKKTSKN